MAFLAKLWNKDTPINGVDPEEILNDAFFKNARQLFVAYDEETGLITRLESIDVIKMNNKLTGYNDQQVMDWYVEDLNKEPEPADPGTEFPTQAELDLMEGQMAIYEQNVMILDAVTGGAYTQNI